MRDLKKHVTSKDGKSMSSDSKGILRMRSPKQSSKKKDHVHYYAGYSDEFVLDILQKYAGPNTRVLDPWNGSGTTTTVCAKNGIPSVGLDINAATVPLAWSRLASNGSKQFLCSILLSHKIEDIYFEDIQTSTDELIHLYYQRRSAKYILSLKNTIIKATESIRDETHLSAEQFLALSGFAFSMLSSLVSTTMAPLKTTNPSWFSRPKSPAARLNISTEKLHSIFIEVLNANRIATEEFTTSENNSICWPTLSQGDSKQYDKSLGYFDLVVSSPPYCTRIDYAIATLPQIISLGDTRASRFQELRKSIMGSVVTDSCASVAIFDPDSTIGRTLTSISRHNTKAANSYYLNYFTKYFTDLEASIKNIARYVTAGEVVLVVQNSYFKEMKIDLAESISELMTKENFHLSKVFSYASRSISDSNPRSKKYRRANVKSEEVLIFSNRQGAAKWNQ